MMLQLDPPLPVSTPLGEGWAHAIVDYGPDWNFILLVALHETGQFKHFDTNDVKMLKNYTFHVFPKDKGVDTAG